MVRSNDSSDRDRENGKTESNSAQQTRNQSEKGSDEETDHGEPEQIILGFMYLQDISLNYGKMTNVFQ